MTRKRTHFLSEETVAQIRREVRRGTQQRRVARDHGISDAYVSQLKHGTRRPVY